MSATDTKETKEMETCVGCLDEAELNENRLCSICESEDLNGANKQALQRIAVAADIDMARAKEVADIVCNKLKDLTAVTAQRDRALGLLDGIAMIENLLATTDCVLDYNNDPDSEDLFGLLPVGYVLTLDGCQGYTRYVGETLTELGAKLLSEYEALRKGER